ncbi:hypothetical protein ACJJTC_009787 [Scirpophaga incertulas]
MATFLPRSVNLAESYLLKNGSKLLAGTSANIPNNGIPVPKFNVAKTQDEAVKFAKDLNTKDIVLKAQVLAGGRGKGSFKNGLKGGVRMVDTPELAGEIASKMLKQLLVTKQTELRSHL